MTSTEVVLVGIVVIQGALTLLGIGAAYCNGVSDGYLFAHEPGAPGARRAWRYLWETERHRWPRIPEPPK